MLNENWSLSLVILKIGCTSTNSFDWLRISGICEIATIGVVLFRWIILQSRPTLLMVDLASNN